jgi:hypothetical protein
MNMLSRFFIAFVIVAFASVAAAQTTVIIGKDANGTNRVIRTNTNGALAIDPASVVTGTPLPVRLYDGTGTALGSATNPVVTNMRVGYVKTGAPTFTAAVSTTSAAVTSLTAGGCYRITCSTTTSFRTGTGTPVALTTDSDLFGPSVEKVCLPATDTAIAFVTTAGTGTCKGSLLAVTP